MPRSERPFLEGVGWYARFETTKALDNAINSLRREQAARRKAAHGIKGDN